MTTAKQTFCLQLHIHQLKKCTKIAAEDSATHKQDPKTIAFILTRFSLLLFSPNCSESKQ